ncbi:MAG: hypothetical protein WDO71_18125 [Bacteroidota bacterium]
MWSGLAAAMVLLMIMTQQKYLIRIVTKNDRGNILRRTEIKNNKKGHPIEMIVFDESGNSFGKEIAEYFYDTNRYVTFVISIDGRLLSQDSGKISYKNAYQFPNQDDVFNAYGDAIKWTSKNLLEQRQIMRESILMTSLEIVLKIKYSK